jgi:hypothetical protein
MGVGETGAAGDGVAAAETSEGIGEPGVESGLLEIARVPCATGAGGGAGVQADASTTRLTRATSKPPGENAECALISCYVRAS